jgi:hypothetical protein
MGIIRILDTTRGVLKVEAHRGLPQEFLDSFSEQYVTSISRYIAVAMVRHS